MLRDRGIKKWSTSFMMPEHVELFKKMIAKDNEIERPLLDEHKFEEMNLAIQHAIENNLLVKIMYFSHNTFNETKGFIKKIDLLQKKIFIDYTGNTPIILNLEDILNVIID